MLHLLPIGVNRRIRNTYGLIKKGVGTGFYLAEKEEKQKLAAIEKGLGVIFYTSCVAWEKLFL